MHRYTYKEKEKNMKDKIFGVLQRVGRSFMLPIGNPPGSRIASRSWQLIYQCHNHCNLWTAGNPGRGNNPSFAADYYEQGWKCDLR